LAPQAALAEDGHRDAVAACMDFNPQATVLLDWAHDGLGDYAVWLADASGEVRLCNARSDGSIFANLAIHDDILEGRGEEYLAHLPAGFPGTSAGGGPAARAEAICLAATPEYEPAELAVTVADGRGGYLVWIEAESGGYWLCNASGDAAIYLFEWVHYPLNGGFQAEPELLVA
jgi:hypothetical protein